jgi:hypothetical protein
MWISHSSFDTADDKSYVCKGMFKLAQDFNIPMHTVERNFVQLADKSMLQTVGASDLPTAVREETYLL